MNVFVLMAQEQLALIAPSMVNMVVTLVMGCKDMKLIQGPQRVMESFALPPPPLI